MTVMEQPLTTHLTAPISLDLLRKAIELVHHRSIDYRAFTTPEARTLVKDTHRIVGIQLAEYPGLFSKLRSNDFSQSFCLQITCTNFLYQMVRRLTTELIQVAQGHRSLEQFEQRLNASDCTAIPTEPEHLLDIHGLYLQNVLYDEQDFQRYVTYTTLTAMKNRIYPLAPIVTGEE